MAYQPPVSSTFLSEQTNNHLAVTFLSEQNKSAQPNELSLGTKQISTVKRTGCKLASPI
jgi:hypothetical protein